MRTVAEHQAAVSELLSPMLSRLIDEAELVPLDAALHRILSEDLLATIALPPFNNSQMDGYAVRAAESGAELRVAAAIAAGSDPAELPPGHAAPIMTGAKLPPGADAVVQVEVAEPARFLPVGEKVRLPEVLVGQFVRASGSDLAEGACALAAGTRLSAAALGLVAALGITEVRVQRRVRVALFSTGDEVRQPGELLEPGKIYDANSTLLSSALSEVGAEVVVLPAIADRAEAVEQLVQNLPEVDLLISSGGISQGAFEVVKQAFSTAQGDSQSARVEFHAVAIQPGGPQALGTVSGASQVERLKAAEPSSEIAFLGFPGNPVSSWLSYEMFLRPLLAEPRRRITARLAAATSSPVAKQQMRRGVLENGQVRLIGGPSSHLLHSLAEANALVVLPLGQDHFAAGQEVEVWLL
ncbi:gephyrin-like molybdotransferase Glp [Psychromicrobium lacuslunae]|uniref:Molybdopterin molybdenumtransferase n=1 Tax=Psychromicrobium lacuslunae TaxID=1618207 RepID=A0A0D4BWT7_9MICC|nr:gephyrin-like molybdotransferase Glp [Psychromicrobium lacuslunae]AJT40566.1 hypothetical protein UM93_01680 [Psychromicrobium lacuslunae]